MVILRPSYKILWFTGTDEGSKKYYHKKTKQKDLIEL